MEKRSIVQFDFKWFLFCQMICNKSAIESRRTSAFPNLSIPQQRSKFCNFQKLKSCENYSLDLEHCTMEDIFSLQNFWILSLLLGIILAQEAIVSEITRQTNPTGKAALVHHRRRFLQSLQKPSKSPIIIVWIILIGLQGTHHDVFDFRSWIWSDVSFDGSCLTYKIEQSIQNYLGLLCFPFL